jgi:hypothetical protein
MCFHYHVRKFIIRKNYNIQNIHGGPGKGTSTHGTFSNKFNFLVLGGVKKAKRLQNDIPKGHVEMIS